MSDVKEKGGFTLEREPYVPFTLHQVYEEPGDTELVRCAKCGTSKLEVGCGHCYTVIRCPDCGHEYCIHEG